ncbi:MAG TPA: hypothetical protein VN181_16990, partial [Thermoanaerobaculia bacterium]|nr:hypothetical protein [Thermoanaerobaculia bacterium]
MFIEMIVLATVLSSAQKLALQMLSDVAIRNDVAGIELARQRIADTSGDEARKQYLLAVADYHLAMALSADRPRAKDAIVRANDTLARALSLAPDDVEAL